MPAGNRFSCLRAEHTVHRQPRDRLGRAVPEPHHTLRIDQHNAVRDVREHALRDRALLLGDACPRERRGQRVRHQHDDAEEQEADQEDAVADRRRCSVDAVVRGEDAEARLRRQSYRDRPVAGRAELDRLRPCACECQPAGQRRG